ncbi:hypothetical protein [Actinotalea sp. C106]|uniref:hypothetical protein n=1 Tax=Actinotalea sp. C106 TaxID=2908644 RepID=UPI0020293E1B|nr:hypothetical protein [Actinotalea sp. C106]
MARFHPRGLPRRRPTGDRERSPLAVAQALPHGTSRAPNQHAWRRAVRDSPALDRLRADRRATILAVADVLAFSADWTSMTTRPTWAHLATRTGRSRATIARALATLRAADLLGIVATGRSAGYGPMALGNQAEAAVYVLAQLSTLHAVPSPGDEDETPTREAGSSHPPGARVREIKTPTEPLRGQTVSAATRPTLPADQRQHPLWPGSAPARRKDERRSAAAELQRRVFPLRRTSTAWIAAATREFMLAGWTVTDMVHAIDHRPDGRAWPHDGATGIAQIGRWLAHRLRPWRDEHTTVLASPSQRATAAAVHARAVATARRTAHEQLMATRSAPDSPVAAAALADIRATLEAARAQARDRRPAT